MDLTSEKVIPTGGREAEAASEGSDDYVKKGTATFRRTVLALSASAFVSFALLYCVQPMMPAFSHQFDLTAAQSSLALSVSTMTLALGMLLTGPLSDALGRKPMMLAGMVVSTLLMLLSAAAPNWHVMLLIRALMGLSLSAMVAVGLSYLSEEIYPGHAGYAIGIYVAANALGGMSGRLIGGVIIDFFPWQIAVLAVGLCAGAATIVFRRLLPPSRHFISMPFRINTLLTGYRVHLRNSRLLMLLMQAFLLMGGFVTFFNYMGYRLLAPPLGYSQVMVGAISVVYLAGMYSSPWAGSHADRLGSGRMLWRGILVMLVGLTLTAVDNIVLILAGMLVFTFGFFAAHSVAGGWVGKTAKQYRAQAASLYLFCYYMGSSVIGSSGGLFWHDDAWPGVMAFIGILLLLALSGALYLRHTTAGET